MSDREPVNPWDLARLHAQRAEALSYDDILASLDERTRNVAQAAMPTSEDLSKWLAADGGVRDANIALIKRRSFVAFGVAAAVAVLLLIVTDSPAIVATGAIISTKGLVGFVLDAMHGPSVGANARADNCGRGANCGLAGARQTRYAIAPWKSGRRSSPST